MDKDLTMMSDVELQAYIGLCENEIVKYDKDQHATKIL